MAINFRTIGLPDSLFKVRDGTFDLENFQTGSDTLLSRGVRVAGLIEQRWACELDFVPRDRAGWQEWQAFRATLSGQAVLFTVRPPFKVLPLGTGGGFAETNAPLTITGTTINGTTILQGSTTATVHTAAPRYAQSILMQFDVSEAGKVVFEKGDVFSLAGNLYLVVGRATADAAGVARVAFRWRLWKGAAIGDIVETLKPRCRMQLRTPADGKVALEVAGHGRAGFAALEVPFIQ